MAAPTIGSLSVFANGTRLAGTFSEAISISGNIALGPTFFFVLVNGINDGGNAFVGGTSFDVTLDRTVRIGDVVTLSYNGSIIKNFANEPMEHFSNAPVTNNSTVPVTSAARRNEIFWRRG